MSVGILVGDAGDGVERAVLFSHTTDRVFGPTFEGGPGGDAHAAAEAFMEWLVGDPRTLTPEELEASFEGFRKLHPEMFS